MTQIIAQPGEKTPERQTKTPWNPSRRAVKRVRNPLPAPICCPTCGGSVGIMKNREIYGKDYGEWPWAFKCESDRCGSYVGMHPFTGIPLGTLADAATREARKRAKAAFNKLWENGSMSRSDAYRWLAEQLEIPNVEACHIGWFDVATCDRVILIVQAARIADKGWKRYA